MKLPPQIQLVRLDGQVMRRGSEICAMAVPASATSAADQRRCNLFINFKAVFAFESDLTATPLTEKFKNFRREVTEDLRWKQ